jgi:hypothetical protein
MLELLRRLTIPFRVTLVIAAAFLLFVFLMRHQATERYNERREPPGAPQKNAAFDATYGGKDVKILQFYAREGTLIEGNTTVICYGVLNAKSVSIDPPVEGVSPSLNRCVDVSPAATTKYTLTAVDNDGKTVSASFVLTVAPDTAALPRITSFGVAKHLVERGHHVYLVTYSFENARQVSLDPPLFSTLTDSAPFGQFYASPEQTTTYTLTVTGKRGHTAKKQLTLAVPGR